MMLMLLAATLATMPTVPATDAASREAISAYIEHCAREMADSTSKVHPEVIERCYADDYRVLNANGQPVSKKTLLKSNVPKGKAAEVWYFKPQFIGPDVVLVEREEWWEPKDSAGKKHLLRNDLWSFRDRKWQLLVSRYTVVPFDQPLLKKPE